VRNLIAIFGAILIGAILAAPTKSVAFNMPRPTYPGASITGMLLRRALLAAPASATAEPNTTIKTSNRPVVSTTPRVRSPVESLIDKGILCGDYNGRIPLPQQPISFPVFSLMLSRTLKIAGPMSTPSPPPGPAHWYSAAVHRTESLYGAMIPHGVTPSNPNLARVLVDREAAAVAAVTGGNEMSIFHTELAPPSPPPFADEQSITPAAIWACHRAVQLGLISVDADNRFNPHRVLTFGEATKMMAVLSQAALDRQP
jgi:hypothetical protein